jgi:hypothetical protein
VTLADFGHSGFIAPKHFKIIWLSNISILSVAVPIFVDLFVGFKLLDSELINRKIIIIIIIMHFWINLKAFHRLRSKSKYWKAK